MAKRGLGRGLDALLQPYDAQMISSGREAIQEIKITDIDPNVNQPRKRFDEQKIMELAQSIKQYGVVQPIIVKPNNGRYIIVVGERRWRAARLAGLTHIPAIVRDVDKRELVEIALIENLQREDLNPIEEAQGIRQLIEEYGLTQEQVAERIGWSRSAVANALRLLSLSDEIKSYLEDGRLTSGHARALLAVEDEQMRLMLAKKIVEKGLSVREVEQIVRNLKGRIGDKEKNKKTSINKPGYILEIEASLEERFGTRVQITPGKKKGVIQIEYYSDSDLERIVEKLMS
ncbi:MAG: ParB/RepB/Spo0J family partition protein [Caldicoprobacter oshimai]